MSELELTSNVINLMDVKLWEVSERARESLRRIQGWMVFQQVQAIQRD